ncbi:hypothetical protein [Enterococcus asini]|uniref:hypothetical protein n=1 Tax=Enterococcus TaxID=1350 RepID=UPI001957728D|nr:hypothetical protein [Enterococcus asini]
MKKEETFSDLYDELFEKIPFRMFENKRNKHLTLIALIAISCALAAPFVTAGITMVSSAVIFSVAQKKLDRLEAEQPFVSHDIFKENLLLRTQPNYQKSQPYKMSSTATEVDFGNGYTLQVSDATIAENNLNQNKITPAEGYNSVENVISYQIATRQVPSRFNSTTQKYEYDEAAGFDTTAYIMLRMTGNLIESVDMQEMKESGSFLKLIPQKAIGETQTGLVINYYPMHNSFDENNQEIPESFVNIVKYWLFPDGVGAYVDIQQSFLNHFKWDDNVTSRQNLVDFDQFTRQTVSQLEADFQLVPSK